MEKYVLYLCLIIIVLPIFTRILYLIFRSPFHYPYFIRYFDVSGKRTPQMDDLIDNYIIDGNFPTIQKQIQIIKDWKEASEARVNRSLFKNYRRKQYEKSLDDQHAYVFYQTRRQTRYRQKNYIKTSYKVAQTSIKFTCDYAYLLNRDKQLKDIDYACTLREYHSKNQRKLLTKELRQKIMVRDNYTCQICGKYMPDEVGLQIDHIVPVSKGGKTVASNLQVLCSKCNGSKSNRI